MAAKKLVNMRLAEDLLRDIDTWCNKQVVPTTRTAVIEVAVAKFLNEQQVAA